MLKARWGPSARGEGAPGLGGGGGGGLSGILANIRLTVTSLMQ